MTAHVSATAWPGLMNKEGYLGDAKPDSATMEMESVTIDECERSGLR